MKRAWPADKVEKWPLEKLMPAVRNARVHTAADVAAVADSMRRWGVTMPVLVDEHGVLIAGHCRVLAAQKLKFEALPVMVARGWTEDEKAAYALADNQLAARATWDSSILQGELSRLAESGFEIGSIGFDSQALVNLLAPIRPVGDPEAVPEALVVPTTRRGDVYVLGRHRVACGDSTDAADVRRALAETRPVLMVTDPPYGIDYSPGWRDKHLGKNGTRALGKVLNDERADWRQAWQHFPGSVAYVWHSALRAVDVMESLAACEFDIRAQLVWVKSHFAIGRGDYHYQHEVCAYAIRRGAKSQWASDRKQSTVWEIANNTAANPAREKSWGHGTQKPVECMRRPMEHNSQPGDAVFDPFLGSGTSIIAAELAGRSCIGLELNPAYADIVVRRWEEFTGEQAVHETTGQTFRQLAESRQQDRNESGGER